MNIFKKYPLYKLILSCCDLLLLNAAFAIALRLRFMPNIDVINISELRIAIQWSIFFFFSIFWIFIFQYNNLYKRHIIFTHSKQLLLILKSISTGFVLFLIFQFIIRPYKILVDSRLLYVYFLGLSLLFMSVFRLFIVRHLFRTRWLGNIIEEKSIIIGAGKKAQLLAVRIMEEKEYKTQIVGFLDDNIAIGTSVFSSLSVLGKISDLFDIFKKYQLNSIYVGIDNLSKNRLFEIISFCLDSSSYVYVSSDILDILPEKLNVDHIRDLPLIRTNQVKNEFYTKYIKRIFDLIIATMGAIIISPVLIIIGIGVRFSSKGPVIFKQKRVGKNGKTFDFYKFRSMTVGSDDDETRKQAMHKYIKGTNGNNGTQKVVNESRITPFGQYIRKYSLDELPQLFNVIKGDMSLVGPRPSLPYEVEAYDDWHKKRLQVLPGCSGLWQVSARSEVSFDDSVILDIYYIKNISPWLDLLILLKTLPVMLRGKGGE